MKEKMGKEKKKNLIISIVVPSVILVIIIAFCIIYLNTYYSAVDVDNYFINDSNVSVTSGDDYYFFDNKENDKDAFIFYPGAKVDERAYAPILRELANNGIDVYLMKMPCHMAIFGINKADEVINDTSYSSYYIGGHSMGGAMAASYCSSTSNNIKGLIFFAAYSAKDLTNKENLQVLSIYGSNDGVLKMNKVEKGRDYILENNYQEIVIKGGNHGQFGSYGAQSGDNEATISASQQWTTTVNYVTEFIKK